MRIQKLPAYFGVVLISFALMAKLPVIKPGWNLFSKDQDVQLGQEAAKQYNAQLPLVEDAEINGYLTRIGQKLMTSPKCEKYPFTFTGVNEKEINAFALPGGPTYFNTGLFNYAENEGQIAGVMAHEMSHVILRHGTNQLSKQQFAQIPALLAGATLGNGILGSLAQMGVGLGVNGVLMKYSRTAESQADLYGAQIMASVGYNPLEMARFFEKLEAQTGKQGRLAEWFASHPSPGNRVKAVSEILPDIPYRDFNANTGDFDRIKTKIVSGKYKSKPVIKAAASGGAGGQIPAIPPPASETKSFQGAYYSLRHPANWEQFGDGKSPVLTIAPREGLLQSAQGAVEVTYGVMVGLYEPQEPANDITKQTQELIAQQQKGNASLQVMQDRAPTPLRVDGNKALLTTLSSPSGRGGRETDVLVTIQREDGLYYLIFIAPEAEYPAVKGRFEDILGSVRFNK